MQIAVLPRSGAGGELIPGGAAAGGIDESDAEKALALWPSEVGKAYLAMPEESRCRGFMFWSISFEASASPRVKPARATP